MTFQEWITQKYNQWRGDRGRGYSVTSFAKHLGVPPLLMFRWFDGTSVAGRRSAIKLAKTYPDVYDVLGFSRPDPDLHLAMLYQACSLLVAAQGSQAPDWVRIIANANPDHLEEAAQIAREDDAWEETGEV